MKGIVVIIMLGLMPGFHGLWVRTMASIQTAPSESGAEDRRESRFCEAVSNLIRASRKTFKSVKGARFPEEDGSDWVAYKPTAGIGVGWRCVIYFDKHDESDGYLSCTAEKTGSEEIIRQWNTDIVADVQRCLPETWQRHKDRRRHPAGYFSMEAGDKGPRIEVQLSPAQSEATRELQINFRP